MLVVLIEMINVLLMIAGSFSALAIIYLVMQFVENLSQRYETYKK